MTASLPLNVSVLAPWMLHVKEGINAMEGTGERAQRCSEYESKSGKRVGHALLSLDPHVRVRSSPDIPPRTRTSVFRCPIRFSPATSGLRGGGLWPSMSGDETNYWPTEGESRIVRRWDELRLPYTAKRGSMWGQA